MDGPEWEDKCVGQMVMMGLFCLTVPLPFSSRGKSGGLVLDGASLPLLLPLSLPFPLPSPRPFSFSFAFKRGADGMWEVGVTIKERGRRRAGGGCDCVRWILPGGLRAGAGIGLEVPGASDGKFCNSR